MSDESQFDYLAKSLNEEERKDLLKKIKKITKEEVREESISSESAQDIKSNYEKQLKIARSIYEAESFFSKIIITIISFFTGKKKEEIILKRLFNELKKEILAINPDIINFEYALLTLSFLEEIEKLSQYCTNLLPLVEKFFGDTKVYNNFVMWLIEKTFDEELKTLLKELDPDNIEVNLSQLNKEDFLNEKKKRFNNFIKKFSFLDLSDVTNSFEKFEILVRLITFDFKVFNYYFTDTTLNREITGIKFNVLEPLLEKLLTIVSTIDFSFEEIKFLERIDEINFDLISSDEKEENFLISNEDIQNFKTLFETIKQFNSRVPLLEILQYFKQNLLYKPQKIRITTDLVSLYKNLKRNQIDVLWEKQFSRLIERKQTLLIKELLGEYDFNTLENFNLKLSPINKSSHIKIKYIKKLNILTEFLLRIYKNEIEKIINKILIDGSFAKESYRNNLSSSYYILKNIPEKIKNFDLEFDEDGSFGKRLSVYFKVSIGEIDYTKSIQNTIIEINETTEKIISDSIEAINQIRSFIHNILDVPIDLNSFLLNFESIKIPGYINSYQAVIKIKEYFDKFIEIFNSLEDF